MKVLFSRENIRAISFVEVLIGLLIVGIAVGGVLSGFYTAENMSKMTALRSSAILRAQELLEEIKTKPYGDAYVSDPSAAEYLHYHTGSYTNWLGPEFNNVDTDENDDDVNENNVVESSEFDDIDDYNGYSDTPYLGANIQGTRIVVITDQNDDSDLTHDEYENITYKKITVVVSWSWKGKNYSESLTTSVSPRTEGI